MPPTFAYALALMAYLAIAVVILAAALTLALVGRTRPLAKWLAGGIVGSFPGVFLFQLIAALLVALSVQAIIPIVNGPVQILLPIFTVATTLGLFMVASIVGFVAGWQVGVAGKRCGFI